MKLFAFSSKFEKLFFFKEQADLPQGLIVGYINNLMIFKVIVIYESVQTIAFEKYRALLFW